VKKRFVWSGVVLVGLLVIAAVMGAASTSSSVWYGRYRVGETILFKVEDEPRGWWGCCCECTCSETQILGWHIASSSGQTIYTVVHDAPVAASIWQGSWSQINSSAAAAQASAQAAASATATAQASSAAGTSTSSTYASGAAVPPGYYILYVDTSVGTLSRCLYLYDPCCGCCWGWSSCGWSSCGWSRCGCGSQSTITSCCCRTSLVWVEEETPCCHLFFRWPCCSSCP